MKRNVCLSLVYAALICLCVSCADFPAEDMLKGQTVVDTIDTHDKKEYSQTKVEDVQMYYRMWYDKEITVDELLSKQEVMHDFWEKIKLKTGIDIDTVNYTWEYDANDDRYPFKFLINYEDNTKNTIIEALIVKYKEGIQEKYSIEVSPVLQ